MRGPHHLAEPDVHLSLPSGSAAPVEPCRAASSKMVHVCPPPAAVLIKLKSVGFNAIDQLVADFDS